ncbi:MAG: SMP-30/gluconolactonase/LRE family protein [Chloroflexota bacterium]|nr:SMP-30/gluconolactonase/LRE family protein [Chloroflexota bacterium]
MQHRTHRIAASLLAIALAVGSLVPASAQSAPENLGCPGRPGPRTGYHFEAQWQAFATYETLDLQGTGRPWAVALDHSCNVYVADSAGRRIVKYGPEGNQLATFPIAPRPPENEGPHGVAVDGSGNMYVADYSMSVVRKLSPAGQEIAVWGTCATCDPSQPGQFVSPQAVAVDGSGNVYVLDEASDRVQRFSSAGKVLNVWGSQGEGSGQFAVAQGITIDRQGNVYVADTGNNRIQKFSADGAFLGQWGSLADGGNGFHMPTGIAVDGDGNMYVSDVFNWRVAKLASDGTLLDQWRHCEDDPDCTIPNGGSGLGEFFEQHGLAVDGQGNLYVADTGNNRVQRRIMVEVPNPPDTDEAQ